MMMMMKLNSSKVLALPDFLPDLASYNHASSPFLKLKEWDTLCPSREKALWKSMAVSLNGQLDSTKILQNKVPPCPMPCSYSDPKVCLRLVQLSNIYSGTMFSPSPKSAWSV